MYDPHVQTLTETEMHGLLGGDEPSLIVVGYVLGRWALEAMLWIQENPATAGNYAYCKTGLTS